jgi:hypothetical protein
MVKRDNRLYVYVLPFWALLPFPLDEGKPPELIVQEEYEWDAFGPRCANRKWDQTHAQGGVTLHFQDLFEAVPLFDPSSASQKWDPHLCREGLCP